MFISVSFAGLPRINRSVSHCSRSCNSTACQQASSASSSMAARSELDHIARTRMQRSTELGIRTIGDARIADMPREAHLKRAEDVDAGAGEFTAQVGEYVAQPRGAFPAQPQFDVAKLIGAKDRMQIIDAAAEDG